VTDTDSDTDGGTLWCVDADMDGFGDAKDCEMSVDQPPGTVDNGDDCDDGDADTFPGAAPNDDAEACMNDDDGDDYGDADADGDVVDGTDCDDADIDAFPGAAENEPGLCASDTDGDGWGDANPGGTADPGADCFDGNAALNPDTMALAALYNPNLLGSVIAEVNTEDATLSTIANFAVSGQFWDPVSVTIDETGTIIANNDALERLERIDYSLVCSGEEALGTSTDLGEDHDASVFCGISFGPDGGLYGVRNDTDEVVELDPATGAIISAVDINDEGVPFDAGSCGMSVDCHAQQLLYGHGPGGDVYYLDPATGDVDLVADTNTTWSPTGVGYDPVTRTAWVSSGTQLRNVALDGSNMITTIGAFDQGLGFPPTISNIEILPICIE
jgi:hypothetical protein